jgi:PAS domain S-box-containing protein
MIKVLFFSEAYPDAAIQAAALARRQAGSGSVEATAAVAHPPSAGAARRLLLADARLPWPDPVLSTAEIELFRYDLAVFFGPDQRRPWPDLPGLPPVLVWDWSSIDVGGAQQGLAELRRRLTTLLEHGYLTALLGSRKNSELVLDNLQEGIIAHDLERRIFFFNRAAERLTGYARAEVLGRDCHLVFPGSFCGGKCSFCRNDCAPQLPDKPYSLRFQSRDGRELQLEMGITAITDPDGCVQGVVASFRDLSREMELAGRLGEIEQYAGIIGRDHQMQEIYRTIRELADSKVPVLITGESGTGKELVAAAIHGEGNRADKLFVPINCGALPESLLESELFGHVRGAFTGAVRDKKGRFELADGGTIFLDEIGDISQAMQVKLLRVLQNGTFQRVGGEETVRVDVRVISATNKDLQEEIAAGRFREDLFYRLCVVPVSLPPLRQRLTDIPLLVRHFISQIAREEKRPELLLAPETMDIFLTYAWPGNIRELQNVIRYLMVRCREEVARPLHLPENLLTAAGVSRSGTGLPRGRRRKLSVQAVRRALAETGGNRLQAAKLLGVGRATLYRFLERHPKQVA